MLGGVWMFFSEVCEELSIIVIFVDGVVTYWTSDLVVFIFVSGCILVCGLSIGVSGRVLKESCGTVCCIVL